jgi:hypothetical protein
LACLSICSHPFGFSNAAQTFQIMMNRVTCNLEAVFAYMDDSGVGFSDRQTHLFHLEALFSDLAANGLAINFEKCVFAILTLDILGYTISAAGLAPTAEHTAVVNAYPPPLPGYQTIATFPWLGKLLLRFSSGLRLSLVTLN